MPDKNVVTDVVYSFYLLSSSNGVDWHFQPILQNTDPINVNKTVCVCDRKMKNPCYQVNTCYQVNLLKEN